MRWSCRWPAQQPYAPWQAFAQVAREGLDAALLARRPVTDGPLDGQWFDAATVHLLECKVWGHTFEAPTFCDVVEAVGD
jgi:hypothetical protein